LLISIIRPCQKQEALLWPQTCDTLSGIPRPKGAMQTKDISLRLTPELHQRLEEEAAREESSVSEVIREACQAYLDAQDRLAGRKD
jgi:predicted HicB family RNase H-like nuclease